jgi:hypothetical protein
MKLKQKKLIESYLYFPCNILNSKKIIAIVLCLASAKSCVLIVTTIDPPSGQNEV